MYGKDLAANLVSRYGLEVGKKYFYYLPGWLKKQVVVIEAGKGGKTEAWELMVRNHTGYFPQPLTDIHHSAIFEECSQDLPLAGSPDWSIAKRLTELHDEFEGGRAERDIYARGVRDTISVFAEVTHNKAVKAYLTTDYAVNDLSELGEKAMSIVAEYAWETRRIQREALCQYVRIVERDGETFLVLAHYQVHNLIHDEVEMILNSSRRIYAREVDLRSKPLLDSELYWGYAIQLLPLYRLEKEFTFPDREPLAKGTVARGATKDEADKANGVPAANGGGCLVHGTRTFFAEADEATLIP